ncbi:hypothetical protein Lesp02_43790 [Lentzea sp. NBRC 105346]|nr:hypothetical protein Lesp02_43790 [Lentzea sp. NBRC 105346]
MVLVEQAGLGDLVGLDLENLADDFLDLGHAFVDGDSHLGFPFGDFSGEPAQFGEIPVFVSNFGSTRPGQKGIYLMLQRLPLCGEGSADVASRDFYAPEGHVRRAVRASR